MRVKGTLHINLLLGVFGLPITVGYLWGASNAFLAFFGLCLIVGLISVVKR